MLKTDQSTSLQKIQAVKKASRSLAKLDSSQINAVLIDLADRIPSHQKEILAENKRDLSQLGKSDPKYDRLLLSETRLGEIASDIKQVARLDSPLGRELEKRTLKNGLEVSRVSVPLGVIGIIYEARPNVTFDVFALSFKSGNALVLKGGADADRSNRAIVKLIQLVLKEHGIDPQIVELLPSSRQAAEDLLQSVGLIDVVIPRGGQSLIDFVRHRAKVPVIETGAGIAHTYVDETADLERAALIIANAKTRRVAVCNALDTLLVHVSHLPYLGTLLEKLAHAKVELFADSRAFEALISSYPKELLKRATPESFSIEFLSLKMGVKIVDDLEEAIEHIANHSSKHSEAILSKDENRIDWFLKKVDAAVVYANASTAFTDGAQLGLGAEIGISTQKLHARGPMGLLELTSYKWVIRGEGQIRVDGEV